MSVFPTDINDFISQSGWFSHPGLAHGKSALQHVVARKAGVPYDVFATLQKAVYVFDYRNGEKVYNRVTSNIRRRPLLNAFAKSVYNVAIAFSTRVYSLVTYLCSCCQSVMAKMVW